MTRTELILRLDAPIFDQLVSIWGWDPSSHALNRPYKCMSCDPYYQLPQQPERQVAFGLLGAEPDLPTVTEPASDSDPIEGLLLFDGLLV